MNMYNQVSFYPPSSNYFRRPEDDESNIASMVEDYKLDRYKEINKVEIARASGFVHHPSRETNSILEGEMLKNDQNRIFESMRIMMAEYCVTKGI